MVRPNSPYLGGAPNSSARAINPSPSLDDGASTPPTAHPPSSQSQPRPRCRRLERRLDQHIDKPLRRHKWTSKNREWTRSQLGRERRDFFDTRVTGRTEVWQTIHAALEALWADTTGQDSDALAMAQTILSAADISIPTGNLANGVYDTLGNFYSLPDLIVCDPTNVAPGSSHDEDDDDNGDDAKPVLSSSGGGTRPNDDPDDDDETPATSTATRGGRGKAVAEAHEEQVTLRVRLSENGCDYQVSVALSENVRSVVRKVDHVLAPDKKIRLAYMGKLLKDNLSLEVQGWHQGHIINALVFDRC
ncbi:UBQ protein [Geosmithia morbida]|uniref:UBQ protein n=1 Tax=Geosmithia morbida TaxID=1094350 RepID=A0A9P4YT87_9HYPO|nr:UBQ protein [Geosmithia morbida]KAF4122370.1 UBQ protein [Geosmithia morbida]